MQADHARLAEDHLQDGAELEALAVKTSGHLAPPRRRWTAARMTQTAATTMTTIALEEWSFSSSSLLSRAMSEAPNPDPRPAWPIATASRTVDQIFSCCTTVASLGRRRTPAVAWRTTQA